MAKKPKNATVIKLVQEVTITYDADAVGPRAIQKAAKEFLSEDEQYLGERLEEVVDFEVTEKQHDYVSENRGDGSSFVTVKTKVKRVAE